MAISTKSIRDSLQTTLSGISAAVYEENVWAVYFDYNHDDMTYTVAKIEPWSIRSPSGPYKVQRIAGAVDEMDAYKKFMERAGR